MTDRSVAVRLRLEVASYIASAKQAKAATVDLTNSTLQSATKNKQAFTQAGLAIGAVGVAAGIAGAKALSAFANFDQAMSGVQAATHASADAMGSLRDAALDAGARTVFSATEAADAIEQLAKAGVSTRDILGGGLNGALDLAAAGSLDVGQAAEIAATAMTQFGLSGSTVPHVADLLAAAAGKAQGEVSDMGMALKQSGLVADQTGLSIEETTAGLAAFAHAGLLGSDAGTSFKSMLQRLTPQSDEAAGLMEKLGISAYDAQGNFIGLEKFAGNLQTSLAGLTVEQRNSSLATIFGSDAVRAAAVLYDQGAAGIADWTKKVDDAGFAQETAAIKLDNLKGDIEAFSGSVETAFIKSGSAANGFSRGIVQGATGVVNAYSGLPHAAQTAVVGIGGVTAAASTLAGGFLILLPRIAETRAAMVTLGISSRTAGLAMGTLKFGAVGVAAAAAGLGIVALIDSFEAAAPGVGELTDNLVDFVTTGTSVGALAKTLGTNFDDLGHRIKVANENKWLSLHDTRGDIGEARKDIEALDNALAGLVSGGHADVASKAFEQMTAAAGRQGVSLDELKAKFPGYAEALAGASAEAKLSADAQSGMGGAAKAAGGKIDLEAKSLKDLEKELRDVTGLVLGLRDAQRQYEANLDEVDAARVKNGKTLDVHTTKGRENAAALDAVASSANDVLQAMIDSDRPYADVTKKLAEQRAVLVAAAIGFGATKEGAKQYAASVLQIPKVAPTKVKADTVEARTALTEIQTKLDRLDGATVTSTVLVQQINTRAGAAAKQDRTTHADGGWITGPGGPRDDAVPAWLSAGEFVVNAASAARNAAALEAMNGGGRYANGGWVNGRGGGSLGMSEDAVGRIVAAVRTARPLILQASGRDLSEQELVAEAVFANRAGRLS